MTKKAFLGLFEVEENETSQPYNRYTKIPEFNSINVSGNVDTSQLTTIDGIYATSGLGDTSKSIIKAHELKNALPTTLAEDIAKQTLAGIMTAAGLNKEDCIIDGHSRINALQNACEAMAKSALDTITKSEMEIEEYKAKIAVLEEKISVAKKTQEEQEQLITAEIEKIQAMITFLS